MATVTIIVDKFSKYSIDLKEEYSPDEFISTIEGHIRKVKNLISIPSIIGSKINKGSMDETDELFNSNKFFRQLNLKVEALGKDIYKRDSKTMRAFKFNRKIDRTDGLVWLAPRGNSLYVYFRKGDYKSVDRDNKIIRTGTFGNYPMMVIKEDKDIDYAFTIIKKIYQLA